MDFLNFWWCYFFKFAFDRQWTRVLMFGKFCSTIYCHSCIANILLYLSPVGTSRGRQWFSDQSLIKLIRKNLKRTVEMCIYKALCAQKSLINKHLITFRESKQTAINSVCNKFCVHTHINLAVLKYTNKFLIIILVNIDNLQSQRPSVRQFQITIIWSDQRAPPFDL